MAAKLACMELQQQQGKNQPPDVKNHENNGNFHEIPRGDPLQVSS